MRETISGWESKFSRGCLIKPDVVIGTNSPSTLSAYVVLLPLIPFGGTSDTHLRSQVFFEVEESGNTVRAVQGGEQLAARARDSRWVPDCRRRARRM